MVDFFDLDMVEWLDPWVLNLNPPETYFLLSIGSLLSLALRDILFWGLLIIILFCGFFLGCILLLVRRLI